MATLADLKAYLGITSTNDDAVLQDCLDMAQALVDVRNVKWDSTSEAYVTSDAPATVVDRAAIAVAAEIWNQKKAPNGISQFAAYDGVNPIRVARDPMVAAYPLLAPWVVMGV